MTPREYAEVFLNGLFVENSIGEMIAKVERPMELLHPSKKEDVDDYLRDSRFGKGMHRTAETGEGQ